MLPNVEIIVENGNLGFVATTADGVAGLVVPATAKPNLPLYSPRQIFSLKEAETLGLTEANDATEKIDAWQQIKEFYAEGGNGAELFIMTVPFERPMSELCDAGNVVNGVRTLLDYADGRIRVLGIGRYIDPTVTYNQVSLGGIDNDAHLAAQKLNVLAMEYMGNFAPFVGLVDARGWNGVVADLVDLRTYTYRKVAMVLASSVAGKKSAAIGLTLGRLARIPVQRNIGRVKSDALNIDRGFLTDGKEIKKFTTAALSAIHDKGYIIFRKFVGRSGVYFNDDSTATTANDDYLTLSNNRTIHKALIVAYNTYVDEINEEIDIASDGKINATQIAYLSQKISNALKVLMLEEGNISGYEVFIDPNQNVIVTDKIVISGHITPGGKSKKIKFNLGFQNPALT
jgi:hypothetical protein